MVNELEKLQTRNAPLRLAEFILELCPEESGAASITLPFSKHCLAARLKLKPETLSRAFTRLKQYGVVTDRGSNVTIESLGRLQELITN
jgi:CRP-like cAMP-binding protein